jgi:hypothetical protein
MPAGFAGVLCRCGFANVHRMYNPIFIEKNFKSAFFTQHHGLIRAIRNNIAHAWSQNGDIETKQE